jgi:paired amphipathic helix protein Sin3a
LNDEWVSHPTWASEEAGFVVNKKTPFEEALHKSEEERHEYHVQIEALTRTIAVMEPINSRIDEMTNEERANFKLKADFGGPGMTIYHRIIKKIYGKDMGVEVIQALQDCPSVAVPVVLNRLKAKDEEWRRAQRDWSRTWREVDHKNYYKSLDYQGINFKQNDKKNITAKHFLTIIQSVKKQQVKKWERRGWKAFHRGSMGHQLEFHFKNTKVLLDTLKLVQSFLGRSHAQYNPQERRGIEKFLRSFVPALCMSSEADFSGGLQLDTSGEDDAMQEGQIDGQRSSGRRSAGTPQSVQSSGVHANDLRRKLLKTMKEKASAGGTSASRKDSRTTPSGVGSRAASPSSGYRSPHFTSSARFEDELSDSPDVWIREATLQSHPEGFIPEKDRPFFANTTFYTLFRLLEVRPCFVTIRTASYADLVAVLTAATLS